MDQTQDLEITVRESDFSPHSSLPEEAVRDELEKILKSATFRAAHGQRGFLRYAHDSRRQCQEVG